MATKSLNHRTNDTRTPRMEKDEKVLVETMQITVKEELAVHEIIMK